MEHQVEVLLLLMPKGCNNHWMVTWTGVVQLAQAAAYVGLKECIALKKHMDDQ
jgi:hypothetical protein